MMVCSLPRATSHRNITPVFLEVRTKNPAGKQMSHILVTASLIADETLCVFSYSLTVSCRLAVLRCKVDTTTNTASRMGHYPQSTLQDGCHHCYVCTMPKQTAVLQTVILTEALTLQHATYVSLQEALVFWIKQQKTDCSSYFRVSVDFPHIVNFCFTIVTSSHFQVLFYDL